MDCQQVYVFNPLDYKYVEVWMESKDILTSLNTHPQDATSIKKPTSNCRNKSGCQHFFYIQIKVTSIQEQKHSNFLKL